MTIHGSCDCGSKWTGERIAHCVKCHHSFSTDKVFDRHVGKLGCTDPSRFRDTQGRKVFAPTFPKGSTELVWTLRDDRPNPFSASGTNQGAANRGQVAV